MIEYLAHIMADANAEVFDDLSVQERGRYRRMARAIQMAPKHIFSEQREGDVETPVKVGVYRRLIKEMSDRTLTLDVNKNFRYSQHFEGDAWHELLSGYRGGLDGAKRFFKTMLPGTSQYSVATDPLCLKATVCWWPEGLAGGVELYGEAWTEENEASARVMSVLDALIKYEIHQCLRANWEM